MRNTATYISSTSANFPKYEDLPGHHLLSIRSLIASSPDESYPETASPIADDVNFFMNNFTAEKAEDYSGVRDPDALRTFQLAMAYCLNCSEDSSEGDFDPSRECFMVDLADEQNDNAPSNDGDAGADARAKQPVVPPEAPPRQARWRDKLSWRSSKSFKPSSMSSVNKPRSCAPHSSSSIPRVVHTPRRRDVLPGSASWPTTTSTNLRN